MGISKKEVDERIRFFKERCAEAGLKNTNQRIVIFQEIASNDEHPDARTIFERVKKKLPAVSLDTVYRTLWTFSDIGLIAPMGPRQERNRFDANLKPHHHFICVECGFTRDVPDEPIDHLPVPSAAKKYGAVDCSRIEFRGLCHACLKKKK